MFKFFFTCLILLGSVFTRAEAHHGHNDEIHHQHAKNEITADQLKTFLDQKKEMVILDARTKPYFDGVLLQGAKWLPADSSEETILKTTPTQDSFVIVYCGGPQCPASGFLYDKLNSMGYHDVYEYQGGLPEWVKKGYPTSKHKQ